VQKILASRKALLELEELAIPGPSGETALPRLGHMFLAQHEGIDHLRDIFQSRQHNPVPFPKPVALILNAGLVAKFSY